MPISNINLHTICMKTVCMKSYTQADWVSEMDILVYKGVISRCMPRIQGTSILFTGGGGGWYISPDVLQKVTI